MSRDPQINFACSPKTRRGEPEIAASKTISSWGNKSDCISSLGGRPSHANVCVCVFCVSVCPSLSCALFGNVLQENRPILRVQVLFLLRQTHMGNEGKLDRSPVHRTEPKTEAVPRGDPGSSPGCSWDLRWFHCQRKWGNITHIRVWLKMGL